MMRAGSLLRLLLFGLLLALPGLGHAQDPGLASAASIQDFKPGELLVKFVTASPTDQASSKALETLARYGATRLETIRGIGTEIWRVPEGQELALARTLAMLPEVVYAEPNYWVYALFTPDDPYYTAQWAHPMIGSPGAWDVSIGSNLVTVAVLDTGVDVDHPELQDKLIDPYNCVDPSNPSTDVDDVDGHGTHVTGIAGALGNNGQGVAGMAWAVRIMPVKVLGDDGIGTPAGFAAGIVYAVDNGADIVNLSLGGVVDSPTLYNGVRYAYDRGVLVVAAAGNCGDSNYAKNNCTYMNQPLYPAAYDTEVFAAAATTSADVVASYSTSGNYVDVAAPGSYIYSTIPGDYDYYSGTSQAAPHVAGLAALLWSVDSTLTREEVIQIIESTAEDLGTTGWDADYGQGRINAEASLYTFITLTPPTLYPITDPEQDGRYAVSWSEVPYATAYILEEDDNPNFTSPLVRYNDADNQTLITDQPIGTWYYRVRATRVTADKQSAWSAAQSVTLHLPAPNLLPIDNDGEASYRVAWESVLGATGYRLQESRTFDFATATTYERTALFYDAVNRDGGTWYYRVQADGPIGTSAWSVVRATTVKPDAPTLNAIEWVADDAYRLSWTASTGAAGYRLQESTDVTFASASIRYLGTGTSYTVTGQPNGTWYYRVEAYNDGGFSPPSNVVDATISISSAPTPVLDPIDNVDGDRAYTVTWTLAGTAISYTLEVSTSPWFESPAIAYEGPNMWLIATDHPIGTWHYRVRAHTLDGSSPWSDPESVIVPAYVYLPLIARNLEGAVN